MTTFLAFTDPCFISDPSAEFVPTPNRPHEQGTMERKEHWDQVYRTKASDEVSWFQAEPSVSLRLLDQLGLNSAT